MTKIFISLIIAIVLLSCKPIANGFYKVNKDHSFSTIVEYRNFASSHYQINPENFYFATSDSYNSFINGIVVNGEDYYLGIFMDDSTELVKSNLLLENKSCMGRVLDDINQSSLPQANISTTLNKLFQINSFINIQDKQLLNISKINTKKIVLLYSSRLGSLRKKDFIAIQKLVKTKPDYELITISLDPVFNLKD